MEVTAVVKHMVCGASYKNGKLVEDPGFATEIFISDPNERFGSKTLFHVPRKLAFREITKKIAEIFGKQPKLKARYKHVANPSILCDYSYTMYVFEI